MAAALAGCDTGQTDAAQGGDEVSSETGAEQFGGFVDRTFVGDAMPEVEVTGTDGATLSLPDSAGQPVLLNLWATWCAPCVLELPLLNTLAADMGDQVRVLTVSEDIEGADKVTPFFAARDLGNLPQWMDPMNELGFAFGGGGVLPLTILYDAQGKEVWRVIGAYDWSSEEARALVTEGLAAGD